MDPSGPITLRAAESLGGEDATLLCATPPEAQLQIGALCRFQGAPLRDASGRLRVDELRRHVRARLNLVPRFHQRIEHLPLDLARPVWIDDADFDLDRHVLVATLPAPGGATELRSFVGDLLARPLDPAHPLWDLWLVDGLEGGDVGVVLRAHHVIADGLSLLRAAMALLDLDAEQVDAEQVDGPRPLPWRPGRTPGPLALTASGLVGRGVRQAAIVGGVAAGLLDPRKVVGLARSAAATVLSPPRPAPPVALNGRVGPRRDFLWTSLPLAPLQRLAHELGATLNDVLLGVVAVALRRTLGAEVADSLEQSPPKVLVPIGDVGGEAGGNAFSFVVAALPVHLSDPVQAVRAVHEEMRLRKTSGQSAAIRRLFSVVDVVPIRLLRWLAPGVLARQPFVNLAVTNMPGSDAPLYLCGARMISMHPIVTGVGNIACIVGVLSYGEELGLGLTVDPDVVGDADGLLEALVLAAEESAAATRG